MKFPKFQVTLSVKNLLFLTVVLLIAFLPISSFIFFIKNDTFRNYFPPKFFMSESLQAGYLPLWNPYINFGIPQYGDMNSGYWSPITWAIASTVGYNAYTVTIETLMYILLGGIGFARLTSIWVDSNNIKIIAGLAFMCCGYHVAHLQHFNWLSGSAFLPWCMWSYISFLKRRTWLNVLSTTLLSYLFVASAHPGLIIGSFYFFAALMIFFYFENEWQLSHALRLKKLGKDHIIFLSALLLLSVGVIAGYSDIIPHFVRGEKVNLNASIIHSSNIKTYVSYLLPFSTVKNEAFFNTELTLRNSYISLTLLLFVLVAIFGKKTHWQKFLLAVYVSFGLISMGGLVTEVSHKYLPLMGYVRLVGEFRIFAIIPLILIAAIELDKFIKQQDVNFFRGVKVVTWFLSGILGALFLWASCVVALDGKGFLFSIPNLKLIDGFLRQVKYIVDSISFFDTIWIQSLIQLVLLTQVYQALKRRNLYYLKWIVVADVILSSLLNIPFTGVGQTSVAHLQKVLDQSPKGFPVPKLRPISYNDTLPEKDEDLLGSWSMYNKQPGTQTEMPYPIQLRNMRAFFDSSQQTETNYFEKPFIYTVDSDRPLTILSFSPNTIKVRAKVDSATRLVVLQNNYVHWYYQSNGETRKPLKEGRNFMAIPLKKGDNNITLTFNPRYIRVSMLISAIVFIAYILLFAILKWRRDRL